MVLENVSEQKIAAREGLFVQLEVKRDNERNKPDGEGKHAKDTALPGGDLMGERSLTGNTHVSKPSFGSMRV